ncbi:MAG: hypothetical protein ACD_76C00060G0001 [uncultured bacterium]|nr:MAG: hypothetical protein ACD_76C00060G0001 [uncultured bacterium]HBD05298.1 hypothetical protein [Candidatus Uhrbacteria bacterium]
MPTTKQKPRAPVKRISKATKVSAAVSKKRSKPKASALIKEIKHDEKEIYSSCKSCSSLPIEPRQLVAILVLTVFSLISVLLTASHTINQKDIYIKQMQNYALQK